jgi:hypothetical protein
LVELLFVIEFGFELLIKLNGGNIGGGGGNENYKKKRNNIFLYSIKIKINYLHY